MSRYVCCLTCAFALLFAGCQKTRLEEGDLPDPSATISEVTTGYPAVVMVILPNNGGLCTGTFIAERAVLTAAHCVLTAGTYTVYSSFGTFTTNSAIKLGAGVVDDPNDIALLIFATDVASRASGQIYDIGDSISLGDTARLVGYGCSNIYTRSGAGSKRTGTNMVAEMDDYLIFLTPLSSLNVRAIIGPDNRAGSCFGDSGGPALKDVGGELKIVGVTHAGGASGADQISQYVNVATDSTNRNFLNSLNTTHSLGIRGI